MSWSKACCTGVDPENDKYVRVEAADFEGGLPVLAPENVRCVRLERKSPFLCFFLISGCSLNTGMPKPAADRTSKGSKYEGSEKAGMSLGTSWDELRRLF
jgi:hypothetical protein